MTGPWASIVALAGVPLVLWLIALGYGLLIERVLSVRLPNATLIPLGFCASVIVSLGGYSTGAGDAVVIPIVAAAAVVGLAVAIRQLPTRINAGWPLLAGVAVYVLFNLGVIATGHWALSGYNIDNDSAYELVLISHLQAHGTQLVAAPPSTANSVVRSYLLTGYPLGAQSLLAVISGLLKVPVIVAWQSFIAAMAAVGAIAASTLSGRTLDRRFAAAAAAVALASALFYQYALQGAIKEVGVAVAVLSALAVMRAALVSLGGVRAVLLVAVPLAAILATFNAAGVPYVGALAATGAAAALWLRGRGSLDAWVRLALTGGVAVVVLSVPALLTFGTFLNTATANYSGPHPAAPALGPLFRPLPLSQISGVWLYGDYRFPVPGGSRGLVTAAVTAVVLLLLIPGTLRMVRAREPGPLIGLSATALVMVIVYPTVVPYAQAKLLMIASPIAVLCALQALGGFSRRAWTGLGAVMGLGVAATVLASDAFAYHQFPVAPTSRMEALAQLGAKLGHRGPVLDSEFEQFAKYFAQPAQLIDGPDAPTPEALTLTSPLPQYDHSFDLNQEQLGFVESFPYVLTRRSPVASRPPMNYRLIVQNAFYDLWAREASPQVFAQLPVGTRRLDPAGTVSCVALGAIVRAAPAGSELAVATLPPAFGYRLTAATDRTKGWRPTGGQPPGGVATVVPGHAAKAVRVAQTGLYRAWVEGDFPRTVTVTLDGTRMGSVYGSNTPEGWVPTGPVRISAGTHVLGLVRGSGGPKPGDGSYQAAIDAVALSPAGQLPAISTLPLARWRSLCGAAVDWVEVVSRS